MKISRASLRRYLRLFFLEEDRLPSIRDISKYFECGSQTSATYYLNELEREGLIERRFSKNRVRYRFVNPARQQAVEQFIKDNPV